MKKIKLGGRRRKRITVVRPRAKSLDLKDPEIFAQVMTILAELHQPMKACMMTGAVIDGLDLNCSKKSVSGFMFRDLTKRGLISRQTGVFPTSYVLNNSAPFDADELTPRSSDNTATTEEQEMLGPPSPLIQKITRLETAGTLTVILQAKNMELLKELRKIKAEISANKKNIRESKSGLTVLRRLRRELKIK